MFIIGGVALSKPRLHLEHRTVISCITCLFPSLRAQTKQPRDNRFNAIQDVVGQRDQEHPEGRPKDDRKNEGHQSGYKGNFPVLFTVGRLMTLSPLRQFVTVHRTYSSKQHRNRHRRNRQDGLSQNRIVKYLSHFLFCFSSVTVLTNVLAKSMNAGRSTR